MAAPRRRPGWAVEGCNRFGHHIAMRLLAAGDHVIDGPPKLSARARVLATGQGHKKEHHALLPDVEARFTHWVQVTALP